MNAAMSKSSVGRL